MNLSIALGLGARSVVSPPPPEPVNLDSRHFGDSITNGGSGGTGDGWVTRLSAVLGGTGTQDNEGIGGQTSVQIADRLVAQTAPDLAKLHTLMAGTNNASAVTTILSDYARSDAAITGPALMLGPIGSGNMLGVMGHLNRVSESLLATYGDNFLDVQHAMRRASVSGDVTAVRAGQLPPSLMFDATHPSNATGAPVLAEEIGRAMRALSGAAEPFIHDDLVTWSSAAATNAVIHTARKLGSVSTWSFASDEGGDLFRINSSGQILRGASAVYPANGIRAVRVRGTNANGSHTGRLLMAREAETDQPIYPVRVTGQGSILSRRIAADETEAFMPNATGISVVMLVKFPTIGTSGQLFTTHSTLAMVGANGQMRFIPRGTDGSQLGTANISSPAVTDRDEWHWLMFSFDSSGNVGRAVSVSPTDGVQSNTTLAGTPSAGTMGLSRIDGLFTNNSGNTSPWIGDLQLLWVAPNYIDFSSSTERDRFFNSTTLAPVTMAADGVVNGISPAIYMRGRMGDWLKGRNFAPSGNRLFAPLPIDADSAVIVDIAGGSPPPTPSPAFTASSISGTAQDGQVLTANATVTGTPTPTLTYQWQRNGTNISGQTASTITLNAGTMSLSNGDTISCEITATNSGGTASAEPSITYSSGAIQRLSMPSPAGYFLSASAVGASTTRLTFRGKFNFPSITNGMMLFSGVSDPVRLSVSTDGSMQVIVEDSGGTNVVNNVTVAPAGTITTGTEIDIVFDANHATQTATLTINGGTPLTQAFSTAGTGTFGAGRTVSLLASSTGTNAVPTGTQASDLSVDRNGTLFKAIPNDAATANADAWHQGGDFTNV